MERGITSSLRVIAASLAVILGASCTRRDAAALVPALADPDSKEVVGYLVIPGLEKALRDVSAIAERFAPGKVTPESLKAQIGGILQDPQLSGLEHNKPILLCALKASQPGQPPSVAAMLPVKKDAPYEKSLAEMGMVTRSSGGLLLVSQSPEGLDSAAKAKGIYDQVAGGSLKKSARLFVNVAGLMDEYAPLLEAQLDGLLGSFPAVAAAGGAPMDPQALVMLLKLEIQSVLALLRQCEAAQIDLDLGGPKVGIDQVVTARQGSALAEGFSSSSKRPSPSATLIQKGFMMGALRFDPSGFTPLFRQLLEAASRGSEGLIPQEVVSLWSNMGEWWGGAMSFAMAPAKDEGLLFEYVMDVTDEAKWLEMMEKGMAFLAPGTALGDLYKGLGIEMKLEKAARERAGVKIHRIKMSPLASKEDEDPATALNRAIMKPWIKDTEAAVVKGAGLVSNDPADLDRMIDEALSSGGRAVTTEAQKVFGAGRHAYLDYDFISLMKNVFKAMPPEQAEPIQALFGKVTSTAPMVFAITFAEGRALLQAQVPLEPFEQMAKTVR